MCATHGRSRLVCWPFFRRVTSFSSALPSDSPHQRIVCETRNYLIGRGPLMCPWAFATQSESHRRPHTDNRAARHGFWKVTLRIAKNGSARCRMRTQANGQRNMHEFRDALTHTAATDARRTHSCTAKRPSRVWLEHRTAHCWGNDRRGGARWLHLLMLERKKLFAHQAMFN